jgi:uncharacterized protein (TIGR02453 family)
MLPRHHFDEDFFPPFDGFPKEALEFLKKLKRNNTRPWFQARKSQYEELVRFPMQCLIAGLAHRMADVAPEFEFHPRKSIFRIYRDTRFSKNKTPYKTNIAASFELRGGKGPTETPGLYLGVEPGEIYIGGGLYMPTGPQLKLIRNAIATRPEDYLAVVDDSRFKREFGGIDGEKLVKAPLGYPRDHPMIEHLKHKQFYAGKVLADSACLKPAFLGTAAGILTDILPLVRWLTDALGAGNSARKRELSRPS